MSKSQELIQLYIGQAGVQIGGSCWELYCHEHDINSHDCEFSAEQLSSLNAIADISNSKKIVPRVIMADFEKSPIEQLQNSDLGKMFGSGSFFTGKCSAASNIGCAYSSEGMVMRDHIVDELRLMTEKCSSPDGFLLFRALGGGTGSGLGTLVWESIFQNYEKAVKMDYSIFPSQTSNPNFVEPYNAILATYFGMDYTSFNILMDNYCGYRICKTFLHLPKPFYSDLNSVIAQVVSSITGPLRFDGVLNVGLDDIQTNLVPYPKLHFPVVAYSPFIKNRKCCAEDISTCQITYDCLSDEHQMLQIDSDTGIPIAAVFLYRGAVSPNEVNSTIDKIKNIKTNQCWPPTGFKIGIISDPPKSLPDGNMCSGERSLCTIMNTTAIKKSWTILLEKFNRMFCNRAFLHHYLHEGVELDMFNDAAECIKLLIEEYSVIEHRESTAPITPRVKKY